MRKRTNFKPAGASMLHLMDRLVDFAEAMPPQPEAAEIKRKELLVAADKSGYKHKVPK